MTNIVCEAKGCKYRLVPVDDPDSFDGGCSRKRINVGYDHTDEEAVCKNFDNEG